VKSAVLYRCFEREEWLEDFISGRIRFGNLTSYLQIEDRARGDRFEGHGHVRQFRSNRTAAQIEDGKSTLVASPGEVPVHSELLQPIFICSLTNPTPDDWERVRSEFGKFVVQIDDPTRLVADVNDARMHGCEWQRSGSANLWPVDYDKGELVSGEANDSVRRSTSQKPRCYSYQAEYRIVLISMAEVDVDEEGCTEPPPPGALFVNLPKPPTYLHRKS